LTEWDFDNWAPISQQIKQETKMTTKPKKQTDSQKLKQALLEVKVIESELERLDNLVVELEAKNKELQSMVDDNSNVSDDIDHLVTALQKLVKQYGK